jgi:hypothetical protein
MLSVGHYTILLLMHLLCLCALCLKYLLCLCTLCPGSQLQLLQAMADVQSPAHTKVPLVVLLINGRAATFGRGNTVLDKVFAPCSYHPCSYHPCSIFAPCPYHPCSFHLSLSLTPPRRWMLCSWGGGLARRGAPPSSTYSLVLSIHRLGSLRVGRGRWVGLVGRPRRICTHSRVTIWAKHTPLTTVHPRHCFGLAKVCRLV